MDEFKWYTLHVQSGYEHRVKANIEKALKENGLEDRVKEIFIPANKKLIIKVSGREKESLKLDTPEPKTYELKVDAKDNSAKLKFYVHNGKAWLEVVEGVAECFPNVAIEKVGEKIRCPKLKVDAKIELKDKLYPGYMFLLADLDNNLINIIRSVPRVIGFVSVGGKPVVVSQKEIEKIRKKLKEGVTKIKKQKFKVGDRVKITAGPLIGFEGFVSKVDAESERLVAKVNIFERQVPAELTFDQVEKI